MTEQVSEQQKQAQEAVDRAGNEVNSLFMVNDDLTIKQEGLCQNFIRRLFRASLRRCGEPIWFYRFRTMA